MRSSPAGFAKSAILVCAFVLGACGSGNNGSDPMCPSGYLECGSDSSGAIQCVASDSSNCGACGIACTGGTTCVSDQCVCPAGKTACNGVCTDTSSDDANCGTCGYACGSGMPCIAGTCTATTCGSGQAVCNGACATVTDTDAACGAGACAVACPTGEHCSEGSCRASAIEHVVLIVEENHSFDSYFGAYCLAPAGSNPTCTQGPTCCESAPVSNSMYVDPKGNTLYLLDDSTNNPYANFATDRDHDQVCELQQIDSGAMDNYISGASGAATCFGVGPDCSAQANGVVALGRVSTDAVYSYWNLAANNALADRYFQPIAGGTASNNIYFAEGRFRFVDNSGMPAVAVGTNPSNGYLCTDENGLCLAPTRFTYQAETVADLLLANGKSFAIYADGYDEAYNAAVAGQCQDPATATECPYNDCTAHPVACHACVYDPSDIPFLYYQGFADTPGMGGVVPTPYVKDFSALQTDLDNQTLPNFAFVKARLFHNEHPNVSTISDGVAFVTSTVNAVLSSPTYSNNTLVLVTWDEGGGFFDHVAPPASPPTSVDADASGNPIPYGTRVPLLALGYFAKSGTVSHVVMEHSSIVKFLEYNFIGATGQLGTRDGWVNNIGSLLDQTKTGVPIP